MKTKRNSNKGMKHYSDNTQGVGARHRQQPTSSGGVGYLNICTDLESSIQKKRAQDPRILQLKKMGLDWRWMKIAENMGFDSFIQMWTLMSELFDDERSCVRSSIPHVKKLIRFQRNMLIHNLHAKGHDLQQIHDTVEVVYKISMRIDTIRAVLNTPD